MKGYSIHENLSIIPHLGGDYPSSDWVEGGNTPWKGHQSVRGLLEVGLWEELDPSRYSPLTTANPR